MQNLHLTTAAGSARYRLGGAKAPPGLPLIISATDDDLVIGPDLLKMRLRPERQRSADNQRSDQHGKQYALHIVRRRKMVDATTLH